MDRRSYIKTLIGATVISGCGEPNADPTVPPRSNETGDTLTESTSTTEVTEITVEKGETWSVRLEDGDRLENVLIDITASGAQYRIIAKGDGWAIRNLGIKGSLDIEEKNEPIAVQVTNPGASGIIENLYLGDGGAHGQTGIYVLKDHAGELEIRQANVQGWPDNGIYASSPGNVEPHSYPGANGAVKIYDSYASNNNVGFRIGSEGSFCKNCVATGNGDREFWGYWNPWTTKFIDCDATNALVGFRSGDSIWHGKRNAPCGDPGVVLENCRFSGEIPTNEGPCSLSGTPLSEPRETPPSGVPTTPAEAIERTTERE